MLRCIDEESETGIAEPKWVPYAIGVRCDDRVISSRDNLTAGVELSTEIHTIGLRYRADVMAEHRVRLSDGRILAIEGMPQPLDQKNKWMIITAVYDGK